MKNKAGLIALGVLAVAAVTMIFGILPNINAPKDTVPAGTDTTQDAAGTAPAGETASADGKTARTPEADQTKAGTEQAATAAAQSDAKPDDGKKAEVAAIDQKAADPTADWVVPAFDVLRVEPDGSTVIAGRAQPNTRLEVINGDQVLITTDVGPAGDFAAIFDKPLAAGDYQLTLRSVGKDGLTKGSQEVATISVPKDGSGELLAMVSKPGEASRVITVPDARKTTDVAAASDKPATDTPATDTQAAAKAAAETGTAETALVTPGAASTDAKPSDSKPADSRPADTAVAGSTPADTAAADSTPDVSAASPEIRVSAVEIEGDKMFVAGAARPGALVRIYADDKLVGEMKADAEGRFVIDGKMPLSVGKHTIRADMLNADGSKVEFRAAVPFDRPEGNQIAVVSDTAGAPSADAAAGLASLGGGVFDRQRTEVAKAFALLKGLFEGGRTPSAEQLAAARSATEIALGSLAEFKLPDGAEAGSAAMAAKASKAAADALAMLKAVPSDAASVAAALGKIEMAVNTALTPQGGDGAAATSMAAANGSSNADFDEQRAAASQSLDRLKSLFNDGKVPSPADLNAAKASTEVALNSLARLSLPEGSDAAAAGMAAKASKGAADALALLKAAPNDAAGVSAALGKIDTAVSTALAPQGGASTSGETASSGQVEQKTAVADTASEPKTVEQAPLKQSKTSVIIRRGDTLWQISRRVYGAGVRYTTIYLANEDQISNPDRILPGQIFGVPDSALPDAEQVHRNRLKVE